MVATGGPPRRRSVVNAALLGVLNYQLSVALIPVLRHCVGDEPHVPQFSFWGVCQSWYILLNYTVGIFTVT